MGISVPRGGPRVSLIKGKVCVDENPCNVIFHVDKIRIGCTTITEEAAILILDAYKKWRAPATMKVFQKEEI